MDWKTKTVRRMLSRDCQTMTEYALVLATIAGVVRNFVFEPVVNERSSRVKRLLTTC